MCRLRLRPPALTGPLATDPPCVDDERERRRVASTRWRTLPMIRPVHLGALRERACRNYARAFRSPPSWHRRVGLARARRNGRSARDRSAYPRDTFNQQAEMAGASCCRTLAIAGLCFCRPGDGSAMTPDRVAERRRSTETSDRSRLIESTCCGSRRGGGRLRVDLPAPGWKRGRRR